MKDDFASNVGLASIDNFNSWFKEAFDLAFAWEQSHSRVSLPVQQQVSPATVHGLKTPAQFGRSGTQ